MGYIYIYSDEGSKLLFWGQDGVSYKGLDSNGSPNWVDDIKNNYSIKITSQYGIMPSIARPVTEQETLCAERARKPGDIPAVQHRSPA